MAGYGRRPGRATARVPRSVQRQGAGSGSSEAANALLLYCSVMTGDRAPARVLRAGARVHRVAVRVLRVGARVPRVAARVPRAGAGVSQVAASVAWAGPDMNQKSGSAPQVCSRQGHAPQI